MKRWLAGSVIVVAAAAAAGGLAASGPARASSGAWYQVYQVNTYGSFSDIAAISKTNIRAVGDLYGKKGNTIYQPFIRHYAGSGWKAVTIPGSPKFESDQVSAPAANDVWVFGLSPSSVADSVAYRYDGSVEQAVAYRWNGAGWHKAGIPRVLNDNPGVSAFSPANVWIGWDTATHSRVTHWDGRHWHTLTAPGDVIANTSNVVPDGKGGYWFGDAAILTGSTWASEPAIEVTGGFGSVVRIPGAESFLQPASVQAASSAIQKPTLYRFDL